MSVAPPGAGLEVSAGACADLVLPRARGRSSLRSTVAWLAAVAGALLALPAVALPTCDRLIESGIRDCNLRLGLDTYELSEQSIVTLTPRQVELARSQRPLHELDPTPEQFGQIQAYCLSHGAVRKRIGIAKGLCEDPPAE